MYCKCDRRYSTCGRISYGRSRCGDCNCCSAGTQRSICYCYSDQKELPFKITRKDFGLNSQCKKFLKIGLPLALQEFLTQMSFLALCAFVNRLGLEASSGYGVACKIVNFAMLVPSALMQSMASFVSQNIGAGKAKRAKKSMFTGIGVGLVVGCIVFYW